MLMMHSHIVAFSCRDLVIIYFLFHKMKPINNLKSGRHQPASETPSEWSFTDGPIVAPNWMLAEKTVESQ